MKSLFLTRLCLVAIFIGGASLPRSVQAAPGGLDLTFGVDGKVLTDFSGFGDGGTAVARQTDGRIVVAGLTRSGIDEASADFALARYEADGTLDSSFGNAGRVITDFAANFDIASAVAIQADGKIVAAGRSQNDAGIDFVLARYDSDGNLDPTFGTGGMVRTVFPSGISRILAVAIQADQKIVAAGRAAGQDVYDFALARYNVDGSLDLSFGTGGLVTTNFAGSEIVNALLIQPDQKIIAAGTGFTLIRYDVDGSIDTTFGPDGTGKVDISFENNGDFIKAIAFQSDGSIVAVGLTVLDFSGIDAAFALARFDADGILDSSFGSGGTVTTDFSSAGDGASKVVIQADGLIVAGGYATPASGEDFALARYQVDGSLDSAFGVGGKLRTDFGSSDAGNDMVLQPDGKIVVAGFGGVNGDFALARYLTDGPAASAQPLNISTRAEIGTGDNVLIGGFIITGNNPKNVILRAIGPSLLLDGVLADPVLELHEPDGTVVTNDNWRDSQEEEITDTGLAPANDFESAIVATLAPGAYTAIVSGQGGGTGVGLVEAYDLDALADSELANISTRGVVGTGDNVMIGGFILGGPIGNTTVVVRGIGPSLGVQGVADALSDPTIDLYDSQGALLASNDNWQDTQQAELEASGLAPNDASEAAILMDLSPGAYTAILRGKGDTTGVGLVEAYNLPPISAENR